MTPQLQTYPRKVKIELCMFIQNTGYLAFLKVETNYAVGFEQYFK